MIRSKHARSLLTTMALATGLAAVPVATAAAQAATPQAPTTDQAPRPKHHSVLKGAAVGAVAGHMTHRRHGALAGAAVGAAVQHHRNKKAAKAAAKTNATAP